ncbi:glycoside hydrolase family 3 N-terminal domain-containing protein [Acidovorax sp. CCYZU-2555]|uniref:glycoside hydrolase family 3 protein n=1 Tax=Acidovorax sp. CCYZU-2555 TaxID=2835042 RepID=UPI001BCE2F47|nr:glycoside hydrolase family 3 N-terminal domain-containing protein [Acidovorax sp. CCYZU-2555]MBS7780298.1 glycoside hydrolase family 3 protein [Acidovorax sp. CCYZU-2555]
MQKTIQQAPALRRVSLAAKLCLSGVAGLTLLAACGGGDGDETSTQPVIGARAKAVLTLEGKQFKDSNGNGRLDPYEDWRLPISERIDNLVAQMTLEEKAGLMLINTLNADAGGKVPALATDMVQTQKMSRFIFRSVVTAPATGVQVTPEQAAIFTNAVQEMSEATRLGIPSIFKSNARNHYEKDPRVGINEAAGAFTEFPKEAGLAAAALGTGDMAPIRQFASVMGDEWKSIGLRGMYGYMADLSTEPRWYRVHETFTEDADLNANIMRSLVQTLQGSEVKDGTSVTPRSAVALTLKHFPGGGPQEMGLDPHYAHGKNQVYPGGNFGYHLKPFIAALDAGVSSVMPYYGVPINVTYEGVTYEQTGMAFSKQIVTDLLRGKLGFKGYVNSDTGIINDRAWGLEMKSVPERVAAAINSGTETLSGFSENKTITDLVKAGLVTEARVTEAAKRLLKEQFQLGLFENPYVDASLAQGTIGKDAHRSTGMDLQRKSVVLLQNQAQADGSKTLPLKSEAKVYTMGLAKTDTEKYGFKVTDGEALVGGVRPSAAGHDYAVIRVEVSNNKLVPGTTTRAASTYRSNDPATGGRINPATGRSWGFDDRCVNSAAYSAADATKPCLDDGLGFGGSLPWENGMLSFTEMAKAQSWLVSPSLEQIQAVMNEVGAKKTVLAIYFRQPYVLDDASGLKNAGAIVAGFGVSNTALLDVLGGKVLGSAATVKPQGKMPFALANNVQAIVDNQPDAPGYPQKDTLFPYGFGLTY